MVVILVLVSVDVMVTRYFINKWDNLYTKEQYLLGLILSTVIISMFLLTTIQNFVWLTRGREVFSIKNGQLSIQIFGIYISRKYEYAIGKVKKFRLKKRPQPGSNEFPNLVIGRYAPAQSRGSIILHLEAIKYGSLAFDYEGESIEIAHDLNMEEARAFYPVLLGYLKAEINAREVKIESSLLNVITKS